MTHDDVVRCMKIMYSLFRKGEIVLRDIIILVVCLTLTGVATAEQIQSQDNETEQAKAPYRLLFNSDFLNIRGCLSPWNPDRVSVSPDLLLRYSVDEVADAGGDAFFLSPWVPNVPLWKSDIYPFDEHWQWFQQAYPESAPNDIFVEYMLNGGDFVDVFVDECRQRNIAPIISVRVNDHHQLEFIAIEKGTVKLPGTISGITLDRWRAENLQYCITQSDERTDLGSDPLTLLLQPAVADQVRNEYVLDWAHPEVCDRMYGFIEELCRNYDIDGIELDFMRHYLLFRQEDTTVQERKSILSAFVARVRALLDETAGLGKHRWLCVRIPAFMETYDCMGIDIMQMAANGVDMFNLSHFYRTCQQSDLAKIAAMVPDKSVYLEMTQTTMCKALEQEGFGESFLYRRTTDEQFYASAHLAYARGAQGVSLFNFAYYREYDRPERGPYNEPPFHVIQNLMNPEAVATMPQHYFLSTGWSSYITKYMTLPQRLKRFSPLTLAQSTDCLLGLDMDHPNLGKPCSGVAVLRVQANKLWGDREVVVCVNGKKQSAYSDTSEPFPNPYPPLLGTPGTLKAWIIPLSDFRKGMNTIKLSMTKGDAVTIDFVDIAVQ